MKRIIITSLTATMLAAVAQAQTDTLSVRQPEEVKVITTGDTLNISIEGSKDNPGYYYNKTVVVDSEREDITTTSRSIGSGLGWDFSLLEGSNSTPQIELALKAQLYAGWNVLLSNPSDMRLKWRPSYEAGIDIFHLVFYPRTSKWWVSADWGIVLNQHRFKNNMMTTASDGTIVMAPYPEESSSRSSAFRTLSGAVTFMGHYRFAKEHSVGLGLTCNTKLKDNCSYKTKYTLSDDTPVIDMNELPIRKNLLSIKAEYMYTDKIGLYLRYTPMSTFKKGKAPDFTELNIGLQVRF